MLDDHAAVAGVGACGVVLVGSGIVGTPATSGVGGRVVISATPSARVSAAPPSAGMVEVISAPSAEATGCGRAIPRSSGSTISKKPIP